MSRMALTAGLPSAHCPHITHNVHAFHTHLHLPRITNEPDGSHRWVTFSTSSGSPSGVQFFEVDEAGTCVAESSHVLEGVNLAFVHDLAVTVNYYVIILGSVEVGGWVGWAGRRGEGPIYPADVHGSDQEISW